MKDDEKEEEDEEELENQHRDIHNEITNKQENEIQEAPTHKTNTYLNKEGLNNENYNVNDNDNNNDETANYHNGEPDRLNSLQPDNNSSNKMNNYYNVNNNVVQNNSTNNTNNTIVKKKISGKLERLEKNYQDYEENKQNINKKDDELFKLMKEQKNQEKNEKEKLEAERRKNEPPVHTFHFDPSKGMDKTSNHKSVNEALNKLKNNEDVLIEDYLQTHERNDYKNSENDNPNKYIMDGNIKGLEYRESPTKLPPKKNGDSFNKKEKNKKKYHYEESLPLEEEKD